MYTQIYRYELELWRSANVNVQVVDEITLLEVGLAAHHAHVGALPRVLQFVPLKTGLERKWFCTNFTGESSLLQFVVKCNSTYCPAVSACEWLYSFVNMLVQHNIFLFHKCDGAFLGGKGLLANPTSEALCMSQLVFVKPVTVRKTFLANVTCVRVVRFHICVTNL